MSSRFEKFATGVIAACALVVTAVFLLDRRTSTRASADGGLAVATELSDAEFSLLDAHALPKSRAASVSVVEVIDLECPFCSRYSSTIDSLRAELGDTVQIRLLNFPISSHRFARSGAIAVECAFLQQRGYDFVRTTYLNSDSIGFWSWPRLANHAGLTDTTSFNECRADSSIHARVDSATSIGEKLGVRGTPTVFLDRWRYSRPPDLTRLLKDARTRAAGRSLP